jgi:hypothetical protein
VLIYPGEEKHLLAAQAVVARQHIGEDGGISGAQVGFIVDVINGCGDIKHSTSIK